MTAPRALNATAASACGPTRTRNEDIAIIGARTVRNDAAIETWDSAAASRPFVAAVLDGLGGHQGGDEASARVAARLMHVVGRWSLDCVAAECIAGLTETLNDARRELDEVGAFSPELDGMGTTCTALVVTESAFLLLHVGDTRCYRRRDGVWKQLTVDHSVTYPDGSGEQSAGLTHAVGADILELPAELVMDLSDKCFPGDVFVLITDGVLNATASDAALEAALDASDAQGIIDAALVNGGPDNATAVRLEILE
ncbi:MAG: PP2C family serine/threonine-protein phosphatase [Gemmatimonadota bacterium]